MQLIIIITIFNFTFIIENKFKVYVEKLIVHDMIFLMQCIGMKIQLNNSSDLTPKCHKKYQKIIGE